MPGFLFDLFIQTSYAIDRTWIISFGGDSMSTFERAVKLLKDLSPEKLDIAVYILESLTVKQKVESLTEEELTPEEALLINSALAELDSGLGVEAESVWKEAGI